MYIFKNSAITILFYSILVNHHYYFLGFGKYMYMLGGEDHSQNNLEEALYVFMDHITIVCFLIIFSC